MLREKQLRNAVRGGTLHKKFTVNSLLKHISLPGPDWISSTGDGGMSRNRDNVDSCGLRDASVRMRIVT